MEAEPPSTPRSSRSTITSATRVRARRPRISEKATASTIVLRSAAMATSMAWPGCAGAPRTRVTTRLYVTSTAVATPAASRGPSVRCAGPVARCQRTAISTSAASTNAASATLEMRTAVS